jgi:hypothetical protein
MQQRRPAPIGPLALAMRHLRRPTGGSRIAIVAAALALALAAGIVLLLWR